MKLIFAAVPIALLLVVGAYVAIVPAETLIDDPCRIFPEDASERLWPHDDALNRVFVADGFEWSFEDYVTVNDVGTYWRMGNMSTNVSISKESHDYNKRTRGRRENLVARLNSWCRPYEYAVFKKVVAREDPKTIIADLYDDMSQPILPFLTPGTLKIDDRSKFIERAADDLHFAEVAFDVSPSNFRDYFIRYFEEKIDSVLDEKYKHFLEPPKSKERSHAHHVYDQTAERLLFLSLSERREYLEALCEQLIKTDKHSSVPDSYQFFLRRFLREMEKRDIVFDEDRNIDPAMFFKNE